MASGSWKESIGIALRVRDPLGHLPLGPDLAVLYGVELRALTQAVKGNRGRFPTDFCFRLRSSEFRMGQPEITDCDFRLERKPAGAAPCVH